ncbi:FMN-binding split barrel [Melia azedarach]|uniref:FMN-binding split barrel n=1 Tax=Melia azedarach TaxID=155640 RepID=A0ACC1Y7X3_MELAZ|nr:FMN-binding split barrel [Melia azedarach]
MKANKATVLTLAEKCKNIVAANWQGHLNTIKADAKGSKEDIYTSKVKYILRRGKPYIWVPEKDLHNVNTIIDERGSFAVTSPFPGPLAKLLQSIKKLPTRVALSGDVVPLKNEKAQLAAESLKEVMLSEERVIGESSYTVSGVLSSSNFITTSRNENLKELLDEHDKYVIYKFNVSSCMYIDGYGCAHEVDMKDIETSKADLFAPLSAKLIDGINQSKARRRALMLFCFVYSNANARDAFMLSVDRMGFDVLGKVPGPETKDGLGGFQWKEFRFTFKEEARDVESFCRQLVQMEEETVRKVSSYSGLGQK